MRKFAGVTAALLLAMANTGRGDGPETALAVVERAIKAQGGADQLLKTRFQIRNDKGEMAAGDAQVPFQGEVITRLPDQGRWAFELDTGGTKQRVILVLNRDKGWRGGSGASKEMTQGEVDELRQEAHAAWVMTLLPLREKPFALALLPDATVAGQAAAGIKVTSKGQPEVRLYFDKKSGLLVKVERQAREAGREVKKETYLGEYKDFGGVKLPTRILDLADGRKTADVTVTGYRFPPRPDENAFTKP